MPQKCGYRLLRIGFETNEIAQNVSVHYLNDIPSLRGVLIHNEFHIQCGDPQSCYYLPLLGLLL